MDECDVPLQQLARLKEKLIKHTRAEEAAVKRIHDLEMQLVSTKHEFEVRFLYKVCGALVVTFDVKSRFHIVLERPLLIALLE